MSRPSSTNFFCSKSGADNRLCREPSEMGFRGGASGIFLPILEVAGEESERGLWPAGRSEGPDARRRLRQRGRRFDGEKVGEAGGMMLATDSSNVLTLSPSYILWPGGCTPVASLHSRPSALSLSNDALTCGIASRAAFSPSRTASWRLVKSSGPMWLTSGRITISARPS